MRFDLADARARERGEVVAWLLGLGVLVDVADMPRLVEVGEFDGAPGVRLHPCDCAARGVGGCEHVSTWAVSEPPPEVVARLARE